ncbi:MAG: hypothetical protein ACO3A4_02840 [Silvanigrellaceae bacterium]
MKTVGCISLVTCALLAISCTNPDGPQINKTLSLDSVPSLPMVDAKTLLISDINVVQYSNPKFGGAVQPLVNFSYSGFAEYVEVATCVESESSCSEAKNIFTTESTLANAPSGAKVVVKLRACVDRSRATGSSNCGEWFQSSYNQWAVIDREKAALQEEQQAIEIATKELQTHLEAILKYKLERANKCKPATEQQKAALAADKGLAEALGKLGQSALGVISNAIAKGTPGCNAAAPAGDKTQTDPAAGKTPTDPAASGQTPATGANNGTDPAAGAAKLLLDLSATATPGAQMIGPSALSSTSLTTIVDKIAGALQSKGNGAAAQCVSQQTATKAGKLTLNDVGAVLPQIAGAIFNLANAEREVALEGICIESLNQKLETAIQTSTAAAKILAAELQARSARLKAKMGGANP